MTTRLLPRLHTELDALLAHATGDVTLETHVAMLLDQHSALAPIIVHLASHTLAPFISAEDRYHWERTFTHCVHEHVAFEYTAQCDLHAMMDADPASTQYVHALLYKKGYLVLQTHRLTHMLWHTGEHRLALKLAHLMTLAYHVDIHPAATLGMGVVFDHAVGIVIGETARVGDDVVIMQNVTLGGTGKHAGDRHPKVGNHVFIGTHAIVLGNITLGDHSKIGAGSVVLKDIPAHCTAVGVPAVCI